jgi:3-hydroxybutyryl-CoA dehydrogenase
MPLVEVIRGEQTPDAVMDRVCEVMTSIGKIAVRVNRDVPGFIGNRMLHALWREAIYLVQEGVATPEEIDTVARLTFALRMPALGPLENMDLVGLDLIGAIHDYLMPCLSNDGETLPALRERIGRGELGAKSGGGFYDWSGRDASQVAERRDRQIVRQLAYLRETGSL